ncbi:hypothetical protein CVT24_001203 [Panaeolus cyanescens]|uniref:Uncharacterized protein n=1 Tax=Panaeolus cyanescens TaxID=181874 RepID=A0A409YZ08_9AGAR|nr:hypothetical protein CVT24_001203 [Panaeolus cyanescens]
MAKLPYILGETLVDHPLAVWAARDFQLCATRRHTRPPATTGIQIDDAPPLVQFNDRHMSRKHILQHVVHAPSMIDDLRNFAHQELLTFAHNHLTEVGESDIGPLSGRTLFTKRLPYAIHIFEAYQETIGDAGTQYASKFYIHPNHETWTKAVTLHEYWMEKMNPFLQEVDLMVRSLDLKPFEYDMKPGVLETVEEGVKERLRLYGEAEISLAIFQFLAETETSHSIIVNSLSSESTFQWTTSKTRNGPVIPHRTQYIPSNTPGGFWSKYQAQQRKAKLYIVYSRRLPVQATFTFYCNVVYIPPTHYGHGVTQ